MENNTEKIGTFCFNTTNGSYVLLNDVTIDEIKAELHTRFPKWTDEVLTRMATNKSFHKLTTPMVKPNGHDKKKGESRAFSKPIVVEGIELNPILKLGKSLHAYHKNGYKQWGVCVNEIFDDWKITPYYNDFERKFEQIAKCVKANDMTNMLTMAKDLCAKMLNLKSAIAKSGIQKADGDKEYMNGVGRRLGLNELMTRIDEIVPNFCATLA